MLRTTGYAVNDLIPPRALTNALADPRRTTRITTLEPILVGVPLREPVSGVHGVTAIQRSVLVRCCMVQDFRDVWEENVLNNGRRALSPHLGHVIGPLSSLNRQGQLDFTFALVAVVLVHGHGWSSS